MFSIHPVSRLGVSCAVVALLALAQTAPAATPRAAVARIIVQEGNGTAYGSGALIDARGEYGLVVTNWHVVRDATGPIDVVFPSGFRSEARSLKLDEDWDLAALVIWRPPVTPLAIAGQAPRPGEPLTICGYGSGQYREATGRCTDYYTPGKNLPHELVELDVEARQGDSGGPILNRHGQLAGVLFGAGQGTTLGSYGGRVGTFLASLAPGIGAPGRPTPQPALAPTRQPTFENPAPAPQVAASRTAAPTPPWAVPLQTTPSQTAPAQTMPAQTVPAQAAPAIARLAPQPRPQPSPHAFPEWQPSSATPSATPATVAEASPLPPAPTGPTATEPFSQPTTPAVAAVPGVSSVDTPPSWFATAQALFALIGLVFVMLQLVRLVT